MKKTTDWLDFIAAQIQTNKLGLLFDSTHAK